MKVILPGLLTLALLAALVYFLMGAGILQPGDLQAGDSPPQASPTLQARATSSAVS
ncbi:MAG: hypothetical protein IMY86_09235 [Chloroflexi bacterium]|nr:hypothetical protein [Chloroflexota bacterium]